MDQIDRIKLEEHMEAAEVNVITYLFLFLALGSSLIHYRTFAKTKAKIIVKKHLQEEEE